MGAERTNAVPASVSPKVRCQATGRFERRGEGSSVPPTERGFAQLGPERNGSSLT